MQTKTSNLLSILMKPSGFSGSGAGGSGGGVWGVRQLRPSAMSAKGAVAAITQSRWMKFASLIARSRPSVASSKLSQPVAAASRCVETRAHASCRSGASVGPQRPSQMRRRAAASSAWSFSSSASGSG